MKTEVLVSCNINFSAGSFSREKGLNVLHLKQSIGCLLEMFPEIGERRI